MIKVILIIIGFGLLVTLITNWKIVLEYIDRYKMYKLSKADQIWNPKEMGKLVIYLNEKIHFAWRDLDFKNLAPYLHEDIQNEWRQMFQTIMQQDVRYYSSRVQMLNLSFVSYHDDDIDSKDTFTAEVTNAMIRYNYKIGENLHLKKRDQRIYLDTFTFIRIENRWKLTKANLDLYGKNLYEN